MASHGDKADFGPIFTLFAQRPAKLRLNSVRKTRARPEHDPSTTGARPVHDRCASGARPVRERRATGARAVRKRRTAMPGSARGHAITGAWATRELARTWRAFRARPFSHAARGRHNRGSPRSRAAAFSGASEGRPTIFAGSATRAMMGPYLTREFARRGVAAALKAGAAVVPTAALALARSCARSGSFGLRSFGHCPVHEWRTSCAPDEHVPEHVRSDMLIARGATVDRRHHGQLHAAVSRLRSSRSSRRFYRSARVGTGLRGGRPVGLRSFGHCPVHQRRTSCAPDEHVPEHVRSDMLLARGATVDRRHHGQAHTRAQDLHPMTSYPYQSACRVVGGVMIMIGIAAGAFLPIEFSP